MFKKFTFKDKPSLLATMQLMSLNFQLGCFKPRLLIGLAAISLTLAVTLPFGIGFGMDISFATSFALGSGIFVVSALATHYGYILNYKSIKEMHDLLDAANSADGVRAKELELILWPYIDPDNVFDLSNEKHSFDPDLWLPFKVEHFAGSVGKGTVQGTYGGLFNGSYSGKTHSVNKPISESISSVIFLRSENGKTLRGVIPHKEYIQEVLSQITASLVHSSGSMHRSELNYGDTYETHTARELDSFAKVYAQRFGRNFVHSKLIDEIDYKVTSSNEECPKIQIKTQPFGPKDHSDSVLITSILYEDKEYVFLPEQFLQAINKLNTSESAQAIAQSFNRIARTVSRAA